ncbi:aminopeptidase P family protein [Haematospirillum jordaniae]|uniref:X-Pro aminopeptidase n=1 Tax=Haematospirillum jordaniae TaxID=1549855 RepID=A0A143DBA0_9PROT|nr:aminopeptidase P family protein [Haematospirillum jordaniae]AMW34007.1 X-Pro aminopeptidase [Haematospirillum jordaniae]NKD57358.1 aminopeptidase P family protein [Haematospirillum jordaniae]NKD59944.1 aminopeptidase P family protein [Haematospirillum jordaniae]NKD67811.1 aminopeptidase P family protein [Haematospirillum jordaniae]NKD79975.1 aminopeptidase P family protein [Haematospirillum jordaniae]
MNREQQASRLARLRETLLNQGVDGFLVPRPDEYQGEYVPPSSERLAWLTGFTGSAGIAVVLPDQAGLFVDGRYTIQAREETDGGLYRHCHLTDFPPSKWLESHIRPGQVIGFDPWLHTAGSLEKIRSVLERVGARLAPLVPNPVDVVWDDRPALPEAPAVPHPLKYAGVSASEKILQIAGLLSASGVHAAVLGVPESVCWLLNIRGSDVPCTPLVLCYALVHANATMDLYIDPVKVTAEVRDHLADMASPVSVRLHDRALFVDGLRGLSGKKVRVDRQTGTVAITDILSSSGAVVCVGDDPCALPRACKNSIELRGARAAHHRDAIAMVRFLGWLDRTLQAGEAPGEYQVAEMLQGFRRDLEHFRGPSFETISAAGHHGAICHYRVSRESDVPVTSGPLYLVDSGGQFLDGTTDVTRTVVSGVVEPEHLRRYTQVLKGHIALATVRFPEGTTGSQLDVLARRFLWDDGLDYDHGTGHGVGSYLSVHEGPQRISKLPASVPLCPGMILSNEPGYYKDGAYGIRIEMLQVVVELFPQPPDAIRTMLGFETLTLVPLDHRLIDHSLLTDDERAWIDAYHHRIFRDVSAFLKEEDRVWLGQMTRPLRDSCQG